ncbi:unnamed protein product [Scytosiphon promiscuus]
MSTTGTLLTIDAILDSACCESFRPPKATPAGSCQLGRSRELLRKAWSVLNKWSLERLTERGSVDVPNFMRVGWQRFRATDGEMRLRPVFILSEGFCRAHGLPHKRILRPPLFKKAAEVVNYSKLAIRYTTSMTKDMMYGALREVFRGIGEAIASGAQVSVAFSFGVLEAKERTFTFNFDCAALCGNEAITSRLDTASSCDGDFGAREGWGGLSTNRSRSSSSIPSRGNAPSTASSDHRRLRDGGNAKSDVHEAGAHHLPPGTPDLDLSGRHCWQQASANGVGADGSEGGGPLGKDFDAEVERQRAEELVAERGRKRGSGRITKTHEKVWEHAFRDHVTALEGQAEDDMTLAARRKSLQLADDRRKAEERESKQREMRDLLTFVQGQIHDIENRRAVEVENKRTGDQPLTFSARRDRTRKAVEGYQGTAWRAPDWGPRRGRATNLGREELLGCLQRQIREREEEKARGNRVRLLEEKAAIDKVCCRDSMLGESQVGWHQLKRSWERHVHLKHLRALAKAGPDAIRQYALSQSIIKQDEKPDAAEGGKRGRAGWMEPGPRAITGPSKLFMKGPCKYRSSCEEKGARGSGGNASNHPRPPRRPHLSADAHTLSMSRRPSTSCSETSSIGFDSRLSARQIE